MRKEKRDSKLEVKEGAVDTYVASVVDPDAEATIESERPSVQDAYKRIADKFDVALTNLAK